MRTNASAYVPDRSLPAKVSRRVVQWRAAAPAYIETKRPLLSITFDDFPKTAGEYGAEIVESVDAKAGYYVATGLLGQNTPMGDICSAEDILRLEAAGHEIAAHTHSHSDCARMNPEKVKQDAERNIWELTSLGVKSEITSFAFPYGETSYGAKSLLSSSFSTMRGILPGINNGRVDRSQLRAVELDGDDGSTPRARTMIENLARTGGWLILFTHDVSDTPSQFGVSRKDLQAILRQARDASIDIVTPKIGAKRTGIA